MFLAARSEHRLDLPQLHWRLGFICQLLELVHLRQLGTELRVLDPVYQAHKLVAELEDVLVSQRLTSVLVPIDRVLNPLLVFGDLSMDRLLASNARLEPLERVAPEAAPEVPCSCCEGVKNDQLGPDRLVDCVEQLVRLWDSDGEDLDQDLSRIETSPSRIGVEVGGVRRDVGKAPLGSDDPHVFRVGIVRAFIVDGDSYPLGELEAPSGESEEVTLHSR